MGKVDKSRMKRSKHKDRKVADFGSVIARNEEAWKNKKDSDEEGSSSEEEEKEEEQDDNPNVYKKEKTVNSAMLAFQQMHMDAEAKGDAPQEKAAPTRREREAMQKEAARKRYEKMHAEGKTDEAKADLERLAKIRAEREAAKKAREAEQEKANTGKVDLRAEYTAALRNEDGNRKPGKKDKKEKKEKKEKEDEPAPSTTAASSNVDDSEAPAAASKACQRHNEGLYEGYTSGIAKPETVERSDLVQGSIEACRAEEEDFM